MHALRLAATQAKTGHELDHGGVAVALMPLHREAEPGRRGLLRTQFEMRRSRAVVPTGQQVIFALEYVRAVTRTHRLLGRGGRRAFVQQAAAAGIAVVVAARAGGERVDGLNVRAHGGSRARQERPLMRILTPSRRKCQCWDGPPQRVRCQIRRRLLAGMVTSSISSKPAASASASTASASRMRICSPRACSQSSNAALLSLV